MSSHESWPESLKRITGTVGLWTSTTDTTPARDVAAVAERIESMGYGALWIPEAWGREAFTHASLLLAATSRLVVATGIANIWGRDAVATQAAAKTLNAAYEGRFILGLGVSHAPLVERLRGHEYSGPVSMMRSYLEAMDQAPSFSPEANEPYARVIAALGPKMLETARDLTHGAHPYLVTPEHTAIARETLGANKFIGVEQAVVLGGTDEEYLTRAAAHLEIYTGLDNYRNSWRRLGFTDEDFVRGGSERLRRAMVVHGDEDDILERVREHQRAGANHVCLQFLSGNLTEAPMADWERVAERMRAA